ncbi:MAG: hypothetical protein N3B18_10805 [Desulfobacterota bacterium]|nr:hypothetical protein [Thermodesulfobacteriota bacterium]
MRGGSKSGIPDIIGIDSDGNICIIEIKNCAVHASIIPQVLQYAFWAESNPDSIKSLWLECHSRPDDIVVTWENVKVRILIIAPNILRSTLDLGVKINYPVDLIEVKRWVEADNEILLVNKLEPEPKKTTKSVTGQPMYDKAFSKTLYNKKSVDDFFRYTRELTAFVRSKGWKLETKYNKHYCGFKAGFFNACGIKFIGSKTFGFFFKLTEKEAKTVKIPMTRYDEQWGEAVSYIEPGKTDMTTFAPLFEMAYKKISGD